MIGTEKLQDWRWSQTGFELRACLWHRTCYLRYSTPNLSVIIGVICPTDTATAVNTLVTTLSLSCYNPAITLLQPCYNFPITLFQLHDSSPRKSIHHITLHQNQGLLMIATLWMLLFSIHLESSVTSSGYQPERKQPWLTSQPCPYSQVLPSPVRLRTLRYFTRGRFRADGWLCNIREALCTVDVRGDAPRPAGTRRAHCLLGNLFASSCIALWALSHLRGGCLGCPGHTPELWAFLIPSALGLAKHLTFLT